jgi:hypothetical protein
MSQFTTLCIGMDVHKDSIAVAYVAPDHGAEVAYLPPRYKTPFRNGSAQFHFCSVLCPARPSRLGRGRPAWPVRPPGQCPGVRSPCSGVFPGVC